VRQVAAAVLSAMCCLISVAACSGDSAADNVPRATTSVNSPSPTSPSPTTKSSAPTSDAPKPPRMPALAKEESVAGAKAFVRYYVEALNYSWRVRTGQPLRRLSGSTCVGCRSLADTIDKFRRSGGFQHGATWHPRSILLVPTQPLAKPIARLAVRVDRGSWRASRADRFHRIQPALHHQDIYLNWVDDHWRVKDVVSR
jgi:Family of unknown function (DUF6318)